jgi:hypothetical protein
VGRKIVGRHPKSAPRLRDQDDSEGLGMTRNEECSLSETDLLRYFVRVGLEGVKLGGDFGRPA